MRLFFPAALTAVFVSACAIGLQTAEQRRQYASQSISHWSQLSRQTAEKFMAQYGPPNEVSDDRLTWYRSGAWKRTEVWDAAPLLSRTPGDDINFEQTVQHHVPANKRQDLAAFGDLLRVSPTGAELTAHTGSETMNYAVINLAHQVVEGTMLGDEARRAYDHLAELSVSGKSTPYMTGLLFEPEP